MVDLGTHIKTWRLKGIMGIWETAYTLEDARSMAYRILLGERFNIVFDYSYLKNIFFDILQSHKHISIINCNSKLDRFLDEINKSEGLIIFDHINMCPNVKIVNRVKDKILIC